MAATTKSIEWMGSSKKDLRAFPDDVKRVMGYALRVAQWGERHPDAKPMQGFGGASVLEVVEDHCGDTYRAVYTVRFPDAIYVLHAFQKKSNKGTETPRPDKELIKTRLKMAEDHYDGTGRSRRNERSTYTRW